MKLYYSQISFQLSRRAFQKKLLILITKKIKVLKKIPTRHLKDISDKYSPVLANIWNGEIVINKNFPENLKSADV